MEVDQEMHHQSEEGELPPSDQEDFEESSSHDATKIVYDAQTPLITYDVQIPFPNQHYAETCMQTIGVDPAFSDSKTKKS